MITDPSNYLWQNRQKIFLDKEKDCFTAIILHDDELKVVEQLDGIQHIKEVFNRIYRIRVEATKLDAIMQTMRYGLNIICHHAYKPTNSTDTRYYITDQITVKFAPSAKNDVVNQVLDDFGLRYIRSYNNQTYLLQVTQNSFRNPIKIANEVAMKDGVVYAEPNLISRYQLAYQPDDCRFDEQWHLYSNEGPELVEEADISVTKAWDMTKGDRSITIAVLDDGFDLAHPDLQGENKIVAPRDFVRGNNDPIPSKDDFHGTPCAGLAIGELNGDGIVGVAPDCSFMPVRIPFGADSDLLYDIFDYVGKHADVISCSWGPPPVYAPLHQLVYDKIAELAETGGPRGKGCVILFAAHNFNAPLQDAQNINGVRYKIGRRIFNHKDPVLNGNAIHPDVICVSASTSLNKKAAYSNWGKEVWVCAPSNNFHPLDYNIKLKGRGLCTSDNFNTGQHLSPKSRYTHQFGGTSGATPIVAGIVGLMLSVNPDLTAKEIKNILKNTADKIVDYKPDSVLNYRKGTYDANGHSEWFGYGKVNAAKAVKKAKDLLKDSQEPKQPIDQPSSSSVISIFDEPNTPHPSTKLPSKFNGHMPITGADTDPLFGDGVFSPAKINGTKQVKQIRRGVAIDDLQEKIFKITIGDKLLITMICEDITANFDIYLKKDTPPTPFNYDQLTIARKSTEEIIFQGLTTGDYFILVRTNDPVEQFDFQLSLL